MPLFKIDDMQVWTGGKWENLPKKYPEIEGFSNDSREMKKGYAFVALKGERDGHEFIGDAIKNGAVGVIASKSVGEVGVPVLIVEDTKKALEMIAKFHRLRYENPVIGITGSCGKTSTKEFLGKLLSWKSPLITKDNLNNELGVAMTLTQLDLRGNFVAIVEAGVSGLGQMEELANMIEPDIAIFTNIHPSHLEGFGEIANIAKEKAILGQKVAKDGWSIFHSNLLSWKSFDELECKRAIIAPCDNQEVNGDLVFRYEITEIGDRVKIDLRVEGGNEYCFEAPMFSKGMLEDILLCIVCALMVGTSEEQIAIKLEGLKVTPNRGGIFRFEKCTFYIDCYNASPASMKDALRYFERISVGGKRLYILGCMAELGLATHRHHKDIGEIIPYREGDEIVVIGRNSDVYKTGLLEKGWAEGAITIADNSESIRSRVDNFEGYIFVKGSRVYELENSLPDYVRDKLSLSPMEVEETIEEIVEEIEEIHRETDEEPMGDDYDEEFEEDFENLRDESEDDRF